jgi:hypothetical protein
VLFGVVLLAVSSCGAPAPAGGPATASGAGGSAGPHPTSTTVPTTTASPAIDAPAAVWQLRFLLLDHYPTFAYCDPDLYPVARADQQGAADSWWANVDHGSAEITTIVQHHGYHEPLSSDQRLSAYRDHKMLAVIAMTAVGNGYRYELSISIAGGGQPDQTVTGVIAVDGSIQETGRQARPGGCPICLEAGTRIATPDGDVRVALLRPGDEVWTADADGHRIAALVQRVVSRATPGPHLMLELVLSDGRELVAAGAHPAVTGTYLRELRPGQPYDGATVIAVTWVTSTAPATFDILPGGPTGTYWANDILIGSTLKQ